MLCLCISISTAKTTIGLIQHSAGSTDNGYVLFAPMNDTTTYLIDKCGYIVHKWGGQHRPGLSVYLLPNGKLLKTGVDLTSPFSTSGGGYIEIQNWDGTVEWSYKLSDSTESQHHDVKYLPNGNILAIVYDRKTYDEVQIAGRNPDTFKDDFWSEKIKELRPIGKDSAEIVWEWKLWDHLVQDFDIERTNYDKVELHPELVDANFSAVDQKRDWQHFNSIDYNPAFDQILVSARHSNEIWIIDHSTTTAEAASHSGGRYGKGGDLLWRWGNPRAYRHGTTDDEQLFYQHDAYWITDGFPYAGSIMVFNNLCGPVDNRYSSVDIIKPPVNSEGLYISDLPYAPLKPEWIYTAPKPTDFLAVNLSSGQMLKNGNVLICNGANGILFEIDTAKTIVWNYINPIGMVGKIKQGTDPKMTNNVFRATFYPDDFSGLVGKDLTRQSTIEDLNENSAGCTLFNAVNDGNQENESDIYPNPSSYIINIINYKSDYQVNLYDYQGDLVKSERNIKQINTSNLVNGLYLINIIYNDGNFENKRIIISR